MNWLPCYTCNDIGILAYWELLTGSMSYNSHAVEVGYYDYTVTASVHTAKLSFFSPDKLTLYIDGVQTNFLPKCHLYPTPVTPADAPVSPPPSPTAASDDMLQTADITLNPGQTYRIQVIFDNTLSPVSNFSGFSGYLWGCNHGSGPFDSVAVSVMDESDPSNHDTTVGSFVEASLVSEARYGSGLLPESFGLNWSWTVSKVYDQNNGNAELPVGETLTWRFDPDSGSKNPMHNKLIMAFGKSGKFGVEVAATCSWTTPIPTVPDSKAMGKTIVVITVGAGGTDTKVDVDKTSLKIGRMGSSFRSTQSNAKEPKRSDSTYTQYIKSAGDYLFKVNHGNWVIDHALYLRLDGYLKLSITPASAEASVTWNITVPGIATVVKQSSKKVGDTQVVTLQVQGNGNPNIPMADIQFIVNSLVKKTVQCKVLYPAKIDNSQPNHGITPIEKTVDGLNFEARLDSTPAAWGVSPQYKSLLWTIYLRKVNIKVLDQTGAPLDSLYQGAPIGEQLPGSSQLAINVRLDSSGTYDDPVGHFKQLTSPNHVDAYDPFTTSDKAFIDAWLSGNNRPTWMPTSIGADSGSGNQTLSISVAGNDITNAIVNRLVEWSPGTNVNTAIIRITWPQ